MDWAVKFDPRAECELEKLDRAAQARILKFLRERGAGLQKTAGAQSA